MSRAVCPHHLSGQGMKHINALQLSSKMRRAIIIDSAHVISLHIVCQNCLQKSWISLDQGCLNSKGQILYPQLKWSASSTLVIASYISTFRNFTVDCTSCCSYCDFFLWWQKKLKLIFYWPKVIILKLYSYNNLVGHKRRTLKATTWTPMT